MTFLFFLLGSAVGSFLNVVIDRLPMGQDIVWKPSHCDFCKKKLRWFELIPLFSFILQQGRCLRCRHRLSWQYPIVELVTGISFVYLYPHVLSILIFCCLLVLFIIDLKHMILPDSVVGLLLLLTVILGIPMSFDLKRIHIISAIASGVSFFTLWAITRGRGLGFGDVKLVVVLGLLLGYPNIVVALYIAFLTGAGVGVILMMIRSATMKSKIAFGPFLILGAALSYVWGDVVWAWWRALFI